MSLSKLNVKPDSMIKWVVGILIFMTILFMLLYMVANGLISFSFQIG